MRSRLYLASSAYIPSGRAVMAFVDNKWYIHEGTYWGFDISDGDDLHEIACDMYEIMQHTRLMNGEDGRKGIFPDAAEVENDIRHYIESDSFAGSEWRHLPDFDTLSAGDLRALTINMVMIGTEKSWYIIDGSNQIVSQRFPEDETIKGVFIPFNTLKAQKEFMERFTREEAEEAGYRLCLVSENDENWIEILEEYEPSDIYP